MYFRQNVHVQMYVWLHADFTAEYNDIENFLTFVYKEINVSANFTSVY